MQDRSTLPDQGKIGYTGNSLCEDGFVPEYEQRPTTDGQGPPGCPNYTSFAFLVSCRPGGDPVPPPEPAPEPAEAPPAETVYSQSSPSVVATVTDAITDEPVPPPSQTAIALTAVLGIGTTSLIGATVLGSLLPASLSSAAGPDRREFIDEQRYNELMRRWTDLRDRYSKAERRLIRVLESIDEQNWPSLVPVLEELLGAVGTYGALDELMPKGLAEALYKLVPKELFQSVSLYSGQQSGQAFLTELGRLHEELGDGLAERIAESIENDPDRAVQEISYARGAMAAEMAEVDKALARLESRVIEPDLSRSGGTYTVDEAKAELAHTEALIDDLNAANKAWQGTGTGTLPSHADLVERRNQLEGHIVKLNRWLRDLPTDDKELEEFAGVLLEEEAIRKGIGLAGSAATVGGTIASAAGVTGWPVVASAVSAGATTYTLGSAIRDYFQSLDLAKRRQLMRKMLGNASFVKGVVDQQAQAASIAYNQAPDKLKQANDHAASLRVRISEGNRGEVAP